MSTVTHRVFTSCLAYCGSPVFLSKIQNAPNILWGLSSLVIRTLSHDLSFCLQSISLSPSFPLPSSIFPPELTTQPHTSEPLHQLPPCLDHPCLRHLEVLLLSPPSNFCLNVTSSGKACLLASYKAPHSLYLPLMSYAIYFYSFKKYLFVYLAALGLICGIQDFSVVACKLLIAIPGI